MKKSYLLPLLTLLLPRFPHAVAAQTQGEGQHSHFFKAKKLFFQAGVGAAGQIAMDDGKSPDPGLGVRITALYPVLPWLGVGVTGSYAMNAISSSDTTIDLSLYTFNVEARAFLPIGVGLFATLGAQAGYLYQTMDTGVGSGEEQDALNLGLTAGILKRVFPDLYIGITARYSIPIWSEECIDLGVPFGVDCTRRKIHGWFAGITLSYTLNL